MSTRPKQLEALKNAGSSSKHLIAHMYQCAANDLAQKGQCLRSLDHKQFADLLKFMSEKIQKSLNNPTTIVILTVDSKGNMDHQLGII
jgi:hypothetical protein